MSRVLPPSLEQPTLAPPTDHDGLSGGEATGWRPSRDVRGEGADNKSPKFREILIQHLNACMYISIHTCMYTYCTPGFEWEVSRLQMTLYKPDCMYNWHAKKLHAHAHSLRVLQIAIYAKILNRKNVAFETHIRAKRTQLDNNLWPHTPTPSVLSSPSDLISVEEEYERERGEWEKGEWAGLEVRGDLVIRSKEPRRSRPILWTECFFSATEILARTWRDRYM